MAKKAPSSTIKVRMYCHGLGDCFLITFGSPVAPKYMLIDSGVLIGTKDPEKLMSSVAGSIKATTKGKIDILVVTHEHWDHYSGFVQARDVWKDFTIGQLWLAWTEDPADDLARKLQGERRAALGELRDAAAKLEKRPKALGARKEEIDEEKDAIKHLLAFYGEEMGELPSPVTGFGSRQKKVSKPWRLEDELQFKSIGSVHYWKPQTTEKLDLIGGKGCVFFLGPPRTAELGKSNPRKGEAYDLHAAASFPLGSSGEALSTFRRRVNHALERDSNVLRDDPEAPFGKYWMWEPPTNDAIWEGKKLPESSWLNAPSKLALALDSATNNTSLVMAMELGEGGPVLFFPGDAQAGSWRSWQELEFKDKGGGKTITVNDLFARTILYKVGHHASHNATMNTNGLERMISPDLVAMIPVDEKMAETKNWEMPAHKLFDRLGEVTKGRIIKADEPEKAKAITALKNSLVLGPKDALLGRPLYVEYSLPV